MARPKGTGMITTSVTISPEFHAMCRKYNINFSEACREGIALKLAELGVGDYNNNLNITKRLVKLREKLETTSQELNSVKDSIKNGN